MREVFRRIVETLAAPQAGTYAVGEFAAPRAEVQKLAVGISAAVSKPLEADVSNNRAQLRS